MDRTRDAPDRADRRRSVDGLAVATWLAGRGRLEAEAREHRLPLGARQELDEGPAEGGLLRARHHRHRVEDRAVRLLAGRNASLTRSAPHRGVGRVDEAGVDLAPRHVLERLADVLGEDELRLEAVPEPEGAQALLRVLAHRHRLRVPDHDPADAGVEQVLGLGQVEPRVGRLDDGEDVAREDAPGVPDDQPLLIELVHLALRGRHEEVDRGAGLDLLLELARRPEVVPELDPRVPGREAASQLLHGVLHADRDRQRHLLGARRGDGSPDPQREQSPAAPPVLASACDPPSILTFVAPSDVPYDPPMPRPDRTDARTPRQTARPDILGARLRTRLWLEVDGRFALGDGGVHLLLGVRRLGSLAAAVRRIGWSYRHAWGYLRRAESVLGAPLTATRPGKGRARGTVLTELGDRMVTRLLAARRTIDGALGAPSGPAPEEIAARGALSRRPAPPAGRRSARTEAARTSRRRRS